MLYLEQLEERRTPTIAVPQNIELPQDSSEIFGFSPQQIRHAYGFDQLFDNYDAQAGAGQTIAIVDAYLDQNSIVNGLNTFDTQFGLPAAKLSIVSQTGNTTNLPTQSDFGWVLEECLDIEWVHVIAPQANIVLLAANSSDVADLMVAVQTAKDLPGISAITMSWGSNEGISLFQYDNIFSTPNKFGKSVAFFAASGDSGSPIYPSTNPNIVAVGGTSLFLDDNNNYAGEEGWSGSGGGKSIMYPPRTTPDLSYDADPNTGFPVFDQTWWLVGGTSAGSPQIAALYSLMLQKGVVTGDINARTILTSLPASDFHDITIMNGVGDAGNTTGPGYDFVTGIGTPIAPKFFQSPNERFVRQLYNELLNRNASQDEVNYFVNLLNNGTSTYTISVAFTGSQEYYHDEVNKVFEGYLGREAEPGAFAGTNFTPEQLSIIVSTSPEALAGKGNGEFNFINNLYLNDMGGPVDPVSYHALATALEHGETPLGIATFVLQTLQHDEFLVSSWYNEFMKRPVDAPSLNYWSGLLNSGQISDIGVIDALFGSEEFFKEI